MKSFEEDIYPLPENISKPEQAAPAVPGIPAPIPRIPAVTTAVPRSFPREQTTQQPLELVDHLFDRVEQHSFDPTAAVAVTGCVPAQSSETRKSSVSAAVAGVSGTVPAPVPRITTVPAPVPRITTVASPVPRVTAVAPAVARVTAVLAAVRSAVVALFRGGEVCCWRLIPGRSFLDGAARFQGFQDGAFDLLVAGWHRGRGGSSDE